MLTLKCSSRLSRELHQLFAVSFDLFIPAFFGETEKMHIRGFNLALPIIEKATDVVTVVDGCYSIEKALVPAHAGVKEMTHKAAVYLGETEFRQFRSSTAGCPHAIREQAGGSYYFFRDIVIKSIRQFCRPGPSNS